MAKNKLIMITGRSTKQGTGISTGKEQEDYRLATSVVELNPEDMKRFGLSEGDSVRLISPFGEATVKCRPENVPAGLAFIAFGPATSLLVGPETYGTGMPDTKGFEIEIERV